MKAKKEGVTPNIIDKYHGKLINNLLRISGITFNTTPELCRSPP